MHQINENQVISAWNLMKQKLDEIQESIQTCNYKLALHHVESIRALMDTMEGHIEDAPDTEQELSDFIDVIVINCPEFEHKIPNPVWVSGSCKVCEYYDAQSGKSICRYCDESGAANQ